jgi:hypothetical protein
LEKLFGMDSIDAAEFDESSNVRLSVTYKGLPGYIITVPRAALEAEWGPLPDGERQAMIKNGYLVCRFT